MKTDWFRDSPRGSIVFSRLLALFYTVLAACSVATSAQGRAQSAAPNRAETRPPVHAARLEQLAPRGWSLEKTLTADLNRDARADAVLLFRRTGTGGVPERIVAIALRNANSEYELAESNRRLIPSSVNGAQDDPMEEGELSASADGFELALRLLAGVGSYEAASIRYRFKYDHGCVRLVAYRSLDIHRATLDTDELTVDFVAGTVARSRGNEESDETSEEHAKLEPNPIRCLKDIGDISSFRNAIPLSEP